MKKVYQTPESKIVPIKVRDILTSSSEGMSTVYGTWEEEPASAPSRIFESFNNYNY